jgi:hypothetical protein
MIINLYNVVAHVISIMVGSAIGIGVSFIVNCTLIEISKNLYFSYVIEYNISSS